MPGRVAQTHPETMAVDSGLWKLLEKMDDGIARVRFHSIIASRPALITIVYQTSVNVSTMTVTAFQTGAGHGGGDGATADAGLRTNEHHSNDLANVHGPALCLGARACIAAFLHPHLIVSLLTFLVMLAHSSTSVPSSEKGEQLSRRSSRTSRGDGETFEQPHQSRPSGEVSAGCCMVLLSRRILALWSARGELERTQDPGRVPRQLFARLCDTPTDPPFRNWLCGQTGTQGSCRLASSRGCPTSWDETAGAAIGFPRSAHQLRRIMFTRSCGLSFRAWARGTAASWTPSARSWIALDVGEFGRAGLVTQRFKAVEMALHDGDWTRATHLELLPDPKRLLTSRDEEELIAREPRDEMKLKRYLDDAAGTKNKDRSMPGDKGKGGRKSEVAT